MQKKIKDEATETDKNIPIHKSITYRFEEHFNNDDILSIVKIANIAINDNHLFSKIIEILNIDDDYVYDLKYELQRFLGEEE